MFSKQKSVLAVAVTAVVLLVCFPPRAAADITAISDFDETFETVFLDWQRAYYRGRNIADTADFDIPFGVLHPYNYTPDGGTQYPLVLYLHGAGSRSNWNSSRNDSEINQVMQRSTARAFAKSAADPGGNPDYHAFVLAPQVAMSSARWAETDWSAGPYNQTDTPGNTYGEYMHVLEDLLYYMTDSNNNPNLAATLGIDANDIDLEHIYVVGDSMGAYGTWDILSRQPNLFAAGIAGAGSGPKNKLTELLQSPIWAFHGENDITVPNYLPHAGDLDGAGSLGMFALIDPTFNGSSTSRIYADDPFTSSDDPPATKQLIYSGYPSGDHGVAIDWVNSPSDYRAWLFAQSLSDTGGEVAPPTIISTPVITATVGQLYTYNVDATGSPDPNYSLAISPSGMTIELTTGLIQWTPAAAGDVNVTVEAQNGIAPDVNQSFTISVSDPPVVMPGIAPIDTITATGNAGTILTITHAGHTYETSIDLVSGTTTLYDGSDNPVTSGWPAPGADDFSFDQTVHTTDSTGVTYLETILGSTNSYDTFFIFENNGNDDASWYGVKANGDLTAGIWVDASATAGETGYRTGINNQSLKGYVFTTGQAVAGIRILPGNSLGSPDTNIGFDAYSISAVNDDGFFDVYDLALMCEYWLWTGTPGSIDEDIAPQPDGDGIVNFFDFAVLANDWLISATP